jgi:hypothetical protein
MNDTIRDLCIAEIRNEVNHECNKDLIICMLIVVIRLQREDDKCFGCLGKLSAIRKTFRIANKLMFH